MHITTKRMTANRKFRVGCSKDTNSETHYYDIKPRACCSIGQICLLRTVACFISMLLFLHHCHLSLRIRAASCFIRALRRQINTV